MAGPEAVGVEEPATIGRLEKRVWFLSAMGIFLDGFDCSSSASRSR